MINRVVLVGRLTRDPELRKTGNGTSVASFTLAVNRPFTAQGQDRQADFVQCVCWNRVAENTTQYTRKGSLVGIEGRIQTRNYQNQQGQTVYVTEVVADSVQFLETKSQTQNNSFDSSNTFSPASFENSSNMVSPNSSFEQAPHSGGFSSNSMQNGPAAFENVSTNNQYTDNTMQNTQTNNQFAGNATKPNIGFDIDDDDLPF